MKWLYVTLVLVLGYTLQAGDLDSVGVTLVRQFDPTLRGAGVRVAQVEPPEFPNLLPPFEVNPAAVGQPVSLFTWISINGTSGTFTNNVGVQSAHAANVAGNFYGITNGPTPQVAHVDNYEASWFVNNFISGNENVPARVVNQSFGFDIGDQPVIDPLYDEYAVTNKTLFVSAVGNGGPVLPPGSCYNGIGVGIFGYPSAIGPTADGRCKPDVIAPDEVHAPSTANSYSTPYVAGAAAMLIQAGKRGDGGSNTNAAADYRTIKALLLNGAVKPAGWTNGITKPLDARYGAGLVNVFNSWIQLKGGKRVFIESTTAPGGGAHPPGSNPSNVPVLAGWDTNSLSTPMVNTDRINHYYFDLPAGAPFTLTATLVWSKRQNQTAINDLDLFLYKTSNSNLVASSVSTADNVEHLLVTPLPPGRYDLQVLKKRTGQVSDSEGYALAFEFFSLKLNIAVSNNNTVISWPVAPTGFRLHVTDSLQPPAAWFPVIATVSVNTNTSRNSVTLPVASGQRYFRLQRP